MDEETTVSEASVQMPSKPEFGVANDSRGELVSRLRDASFVSLVTYANGECVASAGLLAQAFESTETGYHIRIVQTPQEANKMFQSAGRGVAVGVGVTPPNEFKPLSEISTGQNEEPSQSAEEVLEATTNPEQKEVEQETPEQEEADEKGVVDTASGPEAVTGTAGELDESVEPERETEPDGDEKGDEVAETVDDIEPNGGEMTEEPGADKVESEDVSDSDDETDSELSETDASLFTDGGVATQTGTNNHTIVANVLPAEDIPIIAAAYDVATRVMESKYNEPDPFVALSGYINSRVGLPGAGLQKTGLALDETYPGMKSICESLNGMGCERTTGLGSPVEDFADSLTTSLLVHTPFSNNAGEIADITINMGIPMDPGKDGIKKLQENYSTKVNGSLRRFFDPVVVPDREEFETIEGFADVLNATARSEQHGIASVIAVGNEGMVWDNALEVWEQVSESVHETIETTNVETVGEENNQSQLDISNAENQFPVMVARLAQKFVTETDYTIVTSENACAVAGMKEDVLEKVPSVEDHGVYKFVPDDGDVDSVVEQLVESLS